MIAHTLTWCRVQSSLACKVTRCLPAMMPRVMSSVKSASTQEAMETLSEVANTERSARHCSNGRYGVEHLLSSMQYNSTSTSLDECDAALVSFQEQGQWVRALELLSFMKRNGPYPQDTAYGAVIGSCEEHGEWRLALDLAEESRRHGIEWQKSTYQSTLRACAQGSKHKLALELLDEKRVKIGAEPSVKSYTATLWACSNAGEADDTLRLLRYMEQNKIEPCAHSYAAAIAVCEKTSRWEAGIGLMDEMRAKGLVPSVYTYLSSLNLALMGGEWDRSFQLINETRERGVNGIDKRFEDGISLPQEHAAEQSQHALSLLEAMRHRAEDPNLLIAFNTAIAACDKAEQWNDVLTLLDEMLSLRFMPNVGVYNSAIHACAMTNQSSRGLALLKHLLEAHRTGPDDSTIDELMWACISDGNWDETKRLKALRRSSLRSTD